jgi:hypothetical protein
MTRIKIRQTINTKRRPGDVSGVFDINTAVPMTIVARRLVVMDENRALDSFSRLGKPLDTYANPRIVKPWRPSHINE